MRFFTNENKDEDETERDDTERGDVDVREREGQHADRTDDRPDHVAAAVPVSQVPQQRGNSPWSSTPDTTPESTDPPDDRAATTGAHHQHDLREDPTPPDHAVADTAPAATTTTYDSTGDRTAIKDDGGFDDPKVVSPSATPNAADRVAASADEPALKDDGGFEDPKAVDPATDQPLTGSPADAVAAGTTTESKPGEVAEADVATLFGAADAKNFQERWREVQLRFVDSPKDATAEAAGLVDEAVDRLTAALKSQKSQFGEDAGEDTEKLRVQLRGYREIINRIIAL